MFQSDPSDTMLRKKSNYQIQPIRHGLYTFWKMDQLWILSTKILKKRISMSSCIMGVWFLDCALTWLFLEPWIICITHIIWRLKGKHNSQLHNSSQYTHHKNKAHEFCHQWIEKKIEPDDERHCAPTISRWLLLFRKMLLNYFSNLLCVFHRKRLLGYFSKLLLVYFTRHHLSCFSKLRNPFSLKTLIFSKNKDRD